jgi:hypothetical protein
MAAKTAAATPLKKKVRNYERERALLLARREAAAKLGSNQQKKKQQVQKKQKQQKKKQQPALTKKLTPKPHPGWTDKDIRDINRLVGKLSAAIK